MGRTYVTPDVKALSLRAADAPKDLTAETEVIVIHRGGPNVLEKYDGHDWDIPPGMWKMPYGVALHIQRRAVVPGTRNPYDKTHTKHVSFLGILGVDPEERCRPFSPAELDRINGGTGEALDRTAFISPEDRNVKPIAVSAALHEAMVRGSNVESQLEASDFGAYKKDIAAPAGLDALHDAANDEDAESYVNLAAGETLHATDAAKQRARRGGRN